MKKLMIISIALSTIFTFSTMAMAKNNHKLPPAPVGDEITACYKKVNGQLRMVSDAGQCRPSEFPISWSIGPIASSISGEDQRMPAPAQEVDVGVREDPHSQATIREPAPR